MLKKSTVVVTLIVVGLLYQNCGEGFQARSGDSLSLTSTTDGTAITGPGGGDGTPIDPESPGEPDIAPSITLAGNWALTLNETFDGSGPMTISDTFDIDTLDDALNRVGNSDMEADGTIKDGVSVNGKRWSAWYNKFNDETAYRENGKLIMGGKLTNETDPTRQKEYQDKGVTVKYGENKIYTTWLQSWSRKWSNDLNRQVVDPASKNKIYKYGFFEADVDFSEMRTPGFRLSIWLMPASRDLAGQDTVESNAYNNDGNDGVEIDIFEYEFNEGGLRNRIIMAIYGGEAGNVSEIINPSDNNINLEQGTHKLGFLWEADKMVWYINGIEVKRIVDVNLIPDIYSYIVISREVNSGVVKPDQRQNDDVVEDKPYIPYDYGLYAENAWHYRDRIDNDKGKIDYMRVWQKQ